MQIQNQYRGQPNSPPFLVGLMLARNLLVNLKNFKLRNSGQQFQRNSSGEKNSLNKPQFNNSINKPQFNNSINKPEFNSSLNKPEFDNAKQFDQVNKKLSFIDTSLQVDKKQNNNCGTQTHNNKKYYDQVNERLPNNNRIQHNNLSKNKEKINNKYSQQEIKRKSINKKNVLAEKLNLIGHKLHQTYSELRAYQQIFYNLCEHYQNHSKVQKMVPKIKQQLLKLNQQLRKYQDKTLQNNKTLQSMKFQLKQFEKHFNQKITQYIRNVIQNNVQVNMRINIIQFNTVNYHNKIVKFKRNNKNYQLTNGQSNCQLNEKSKFVQANTTQKKTIPFQQKIIVPIQKGITAPLQKKIKLIFQHKNIVNQLKNKKKTKKVNKNNSQLEEQADIKKYYQSEIYTL